MVVWIMKKKMSDFSSNGMDCAASGECCPEPIESYRGHEEVNGPVRGQAIPAPHNRPFNISIEGLDYGYLVRVGCQTVAVETKEKVIAKLTEYLENPSEFQKKWFTDRSSLMS